VLLFKYECGAHILPKIVEFDRMHVSSLLYNEL